MTTWIDHEGPDNDDGFRGNLGAILASVDFSPEGFAASERLRIQTLADAVRCGRITELQLRIEDVVPVRRAIAEAA
jgi:hypothetical protein